ncbi:hypothetical protein Emag_002395 [Eimeria magna]
MGGLLGAAAAALAGFVLGCVPLPSACAPVSQESSVQAEAAETATSVQLPAKAAAAARRHPGGPSLPGLSPRKRQQPQQLEQQQGTEAPAAAAAAAREEGAAGAAAEDWVPLPSSAASFSLEELAILLAAERKQHKRLLRLTRVLLAVTLLLAVVLSAVTSGAGGLQLRGWAASMLKKDFWKASGPLTDRFAAVSQRLQQTEELKQSEAQAIAAAKREAALYNRMQKEMLALHSRIEVLEAQKETLSKETKTLQQEKAKLENELAARAEEFTRAVMERIEFKTQLEQAVDRLATLQRLQQRSLGEREAQRFVRARAAREYQNLAVDELPLGRAAEVASVDARALAAASTGAGARAPAAPLKPGMTLAGAVPATAAPSETQRPTPAASAATLGARGPSHEGQGDQTAKPDASAQRRWGRHNRSNSIFD